jgi:Zn-dependent protease with chaperone function
MVRRNLGIVGSILFKVVYRKAVQFKSEPLDKLAQDIGVKSALKGKNPKYYKMKANPRGCTSLYDGSIIFDKKYYDMLTPEEVLAVGAHEFNHLVKKDVIRNLYRSVLPSLIVSIVFGILEVTNLSFSQTLLYDGMGYLVSLGLAIVFPFLIALLASFYVNASWLRGLETNCDLLAVEFGLGEAMITALTKIRIRFPRSKWDTKLSRLFPHTYPTIEQRIEIIRKSVDNAKLLHSKQSKSS